MLPEEDRQALKKDGYKISANGVISPIAHPLQTHNRKSSSSEAQLFRQGERDSINNSRPIQPKPKLVSTNRREWDNALPLQPKPKPVSYNRREWDSASPLQPKPKANKATQLQRQQERNLINNPIKAKAIAPVGEQNKNNALNQTNSVIKGTTVGALVASRRLPPSDVGTDVGTEASRAAKPLVLRATLPDGSKSIKLVRLRRVHSSQGNISENMTGGTSSRDVVEAMKKHGWDYTKEPPDMVKFEGKKLSIRRIRIPISRGHITTVDHRRIAAAIEAGLKKVPARVHSEYDLIEHRAPSKPGSAGQDVAERFKLKKKVSFNDPETGNKITRKVQEFTDPKTRTTYKPGTKPGNWGETVIFRSAEQRVRGHEDFPLTGSKQFPRFQNESSASRVAKAFENSHIQGVARGASKVLAPVAIGLDAWQLKNAYQKDGFGQEFRKTAGSVAGGWGGAVAGAAGGAAIGSVVPVLGTAAGAIVGGVIGGVAGSEFGDDIEQGAEKAGKAIVNGGKKVWDAINPFG